MILRVFRGKNHGDEEARARDLFYSLRISDLFMKELKIIKWTLMCPNQAKAYQINTVLNLKNYILNMKMILNIYQKIKAEFWEKILLKQKQDLYLYKDNCNNKTNQKLRNNKSSIYAQKLLI